MTYDLLPWAAPLALFCAGLFALTRPGRRPRWVGQTAQVSALFALATALASMGLLVAHGPWQSALLGDEAPGLVVRIDAVSAAMSALVSFIGWVVLRFSATYLDGEARQGAFMGTLCMALASVLLLVLAGDLLQLVGAWMAVGLFLHKLLLFYPERVAARRAAAKKFVVARLGDVALISAALLLALTYRTTNIGEILAAARTGSSAGLALTAAVGLVVLAALLKSAQFPAHGWLTEVMEAPTPVSALLHAGVINAGGFVLIRLADVVLLSPGAMAILVVVGGFTALFAGLVMLTQPAAKTALAWSTIAQMGFMILECGLGLFSLALLHIIAHSLYKAHAFLSAGEAVDRVAASRRPGPVAIPDARAVVRAFVLALSIYGIAGWLFGFHHKSPQAIALGAILIFGVAYILAQGLADAVPKALTRRTALYAIATSFAYFALQQLMSTATSSVLPATPAPGPLQWGLILLCIVSFGLVAMVQAMFPLWAHHPAAAGLRVHLSNGFYVNALSDRLLGGWRAPASLKIFGIDP